MAFICKKVKRLRLDIRVVQCSPLEVLLGQLGECGIAGVLSNRLDGIWAIFRLLGAGNSGQSGAM